MTSRSASQSMGDVLARQNGVGPGFDLLRLGLALLIFCGHCKWLAGTGHAPALAADFHDLTMRGWSGLRRPVQVGLVPMFFALSGFLVTASALRVREVHRFLALRALRIFPALTVEVMLSALLLGPLLTALTLDAYVQDRAFFTYFGNILGFVQFELPGVFLSNPVPKIVNANLWTLPAEFYCYLVTALAMAAGAMFDRRMMTICFAAVTAAAVAASLAFGYGVTMTHAATPVVVYYFFAGSMFYHWREHIPCNARLFALAAVMGYGLLYFRGTVFLAPLPVVYTTVYIGLANLPPIPFLKNCDYSYGIYLYGFPITQALVAVYPGFHGQGWLLIVVAGLLTACFAAFSWHLIEAPMLTLKKYIPRARAPAGGALQPG